MIKTIIMPLRFLSIVIVICFLGMTLPPKSACSQNFAWAKQFNPGSTSFYNERSDLDANGNYFAAGINFIMKVDPTGNALWTKQLLSFSGYIGGLDVDSEGNVIVVGEFANSFDFDLGAGVFNISSFGARDGFILKMNSNGDFIWAGQIGGPGNDQCNAVTTDAAGNIYFTGEFGYFGTATAAADFDPSVAEYVVASNGNADCFVEKLDASGNFQWVKTAGGANRDGGWSIAIDNLGNIFNWGVFTGTANFNAVALAGNYGRYLQKLDASGNFHWAIALQQDGCCVDITDVAIDNAGNLLTTGYFSGNVDFDPGAGVYNVYGANPQNAFIWKLDNSGNFVWAKKVDGGSGSTQNKTSHGDGITTDGNGNVYIAGDYTGVGSFDFDPGPGVYNLNTNVPAMYVLKLNSAGNFIWVAPIFGGNGSQASGYGIEVDVSGNIYSSVNFRGSVDFNPAKAKYTLNASAGPYAILKLQQNAGLITVPIERVERSSDVFTLSPNPTNGEIHLTLPRLNTPGQLLITDLAGRIIIRRIIDSGEVKQIYENIQGHPAGMYMIRLINKDMSYNIKLIKQ